MPASLSKHAEVRSQQRGVPSQISQWLVYFGDEVFDGRGGVIRYFSSKSIQELKDVVGATEVKRMSEFLRCYLVEAANDGSVITIGKRYPRRHLWRH